MGEQVGVENRKKSLGTSGGQVEKGKDKKESIGLKTEAERASKTQDRGRNRDMNEGW